jgi:hypothetical protein
VIEDTVVPKFPEQSKYLLETHRGLEAKAWTMCGEFLTPSQIAEFHDVLDEWRRQNPRLTSSVALIHFLDFAKQIGRPKPGEEARSGGLFAMLGFDPLAGLDPAVQQIEQTRQLAERTIYYMQRLPYIVNLQIDRVSNDMLSRPETRSVLRDADTVSDALRRYADVAAALPGQITAEREALIRQLSGEMLNQQESLRPLLVELRSTLDAGSQTAQSLDAAIRSVDQLMARFPKKAPGSGAAGEPGKPFDINEYSAAAAEFARTAGALQQLVATLDAQGPALGSTVDAAVSRSKSLINFLFLRAAALIVLLVAAVLGAALIYRRVARAPARDGQLA